ncbi:MAG TPA: aminotransferase class V-fold PLP-dependent enzyme [Planctomycetaceae bacterium]|nr:aminotransferase class V-fold PLP-dependent enzyme [Planctomycetaceae bacterium]
MSEDKAICGEKASPLALPDWSQMRGEMPITRRYAYLDHAAVGPLPRNSLQRLIEFATEAAEHGDTRWPQWYAEVERTRQILATSLDTTPGTISLIPNTSTAISLIAAGFPWKDGANVVSLDNEFPSNERPWSLRDIELRRVPWNDGGDLLNRIFDACDAQTQLITVSWVGYITGYRLDIETLVRRAERQGIAVLLDAIQGMGVYPLSLRSCPVHFVAADGHKWMLGPEGIGMLYVREDWNEKIRPVLHGWHNALNPFEFRHGDLSIARDGRRFEPGSLNMAGIHAFAASLDLLRRHGWSHDSTVLGDRVNELRRTLIELLQRAGASVKACPHEHATGIVAFTVPDRTPAEFRRACLENNIVLSARGGFVRASIHAYNDADDLDRLASMVVAKP